jgi:hypothetical protein
MVQKQLNGPMKRVTDYLPIRLLPSGLLLDAS